MLVLIVVAALVWFVSAPFRRSPEASKAAESRSEDPGIADLEARKEAKYREIRDAEMDLRTGKLSAEDHRVLDRQLRAEAVVILKALDDARG